MPFHTQYRPRTFDQAIGHEAIVTRLRGIVTSKKFPSALMFIGPPSAGKTTLARCFAAEVNQVENVENHPDYIEINAGSERSIDDIRSIVQTSKFRPRTNKRIIVIDEAQALVGNPAAASALLKPLEEPSKDTIWILCTMDPDKFKSITGKAMQKRCNQFILQEHTSSDMLKQAVRIAKAEKMTYVLDEERLLLKAIVKGSQGEMRTLANQMESVQQYYEGLTKKVKLLDKEAIGTVLSSTETSDDKLAATVLLAIYAGQFKVVQRSLLDIQEGFMFVTKLLWMNNYILNTAVLEGARHRKVWSSPAGYALKKEADRLKVSLGTLAATNAMLVETKAVAATFATSPEELLSARIYKLIKDIHAPK